MVMVTGGGERGCRRDSDSTRRDFLRAGGLGGLALALHGAGFAATSLRDDRAVILLMLVGGPSQLDSFDPKPDAPAEIRGPFRSIATSVPGIRLCEHLPLLARRLDRVAIVRTLHHDAAPIHETGLQLVQTGRVFGPGEEHPHVGSRAAQRLGPRGCVPAFVAVPGPMGLTGANIPLGQTAGPLGRAFDPVFARGESTGPGPLHAALDLDAEPVAIRDAYGRTPFGASCLQARRLVEAGARMVAVNMFETVFGSVSWDCHGWAPFSTLDDYATTVLPTFDRAYAALLDDLDRLGRLGSTLVVATGEFGRTPRLNEAGGRDHWPSVWSALLAGGGVRGGRTIGASDAHAAEPADRPVAPAELVATLAHGLGLPPEDDTRMVDARPIAEAFA
jgi:uncharacterized protein (DUF1501 family)